MNRQGLYVPKKAYFGEKMAVFGPNILIILEGSKSSGTHISENYLCGTHITENHLIGIFRPFGFVPDQ